MKLKLCIVSHLLCGIFLCAQSEKDALANYDQIANIFDENVRPYISKFVKLQYPNLTSKEEDRLFEKALVYKYVQKAEILRRNCLEALNRMKSEKKEISDQLIIESLDLFYRNEFPGLDYQYFEKVRSDIEATIKK